MALGSPGYAPLEQFMGQAVPATDLYGLGATMIALLSRKEPTALFDAATQRLEYRAHVSAGEDLLRVLDRLVAQSLNDRLPSAAAVRTALSEGVTAPAGSVTPSMLAVVPSNAELETQPSLTLYLRRNWKRRISPRTHW